MVRVRRKLWLYAAAEVNSAGDFYIWMDDRGMDCFPVGEYAMSGHVECDEVFITSFPLVVPFYGPGCVENCATVIKWIMGEIEGCHMPVRRIEYDDVVIEVCAVRKGDLFMRADGRWCSKRNEFGSMNEAESAYLDFLRKC